MTKLSQLKIDPEFQRQINPPTLASAELNPSTWIMADVIRKRISAKNIPIIVDKIAENVFPLCPFNRRRVTAVDSMAHMILDAIGGHPENTAGRRNSMIRSIE